MTQVLHEPIRRTQSATRQGSVATEFGARQSRDTAGTDWIAHVAAKLALREGRHDAARDAEIAGWCRETAMQFADARIQAFVPLLVERIVADRIRRGSDLGC